MPADLEQTNLPQSPRVTNQPQPGTPPLRYRLRFHKLLNSVYFRIGLTVFLTLLLFLTAAFISFRAEQKKHQLEQYEKEIPGAEVLLPTPEPTLSPKELGWEDAVELLEECQVKEIVQAHSLDVALVLHDDSRVLTKEPEIDEVIKIADQYSDECGQPTIGTE